MNIKSIGIIAYFVSRESNELQELDHTGWQKGDHLRIEFLN